MTRLPGPRHPGPRHPGPRHPGPQEPLPVRFAVLGDSFSEGVGDRAGGAWRGWAALLADGLAAPGQAVDYRNLAVSGALCADVADVQTPRAAAFRPHLASVVVGVNDTLRHGFDIGLFARRLDHSCAALAAHGTVLLTACLPDPGRMLGLPPPLARPLARRQRSVNAVVHALTARHGAVHLHLADPVWTDDRALWSADRLHPGERGHRAVAAAFHRLLAERGLAHGPAPSLEAGEPPPGRAETLLWLATAGTGWVLRRSRDLLPQLLLLAGEELLHGAAGTGSGPLDARAESALAAALAQTGLTETGLTETGLTETGLTESVPTRTGWTETDPAATGPGTTAPGRTAPRATGLAAAPPAATMGE